MTSMFKILLSRLLIPLTLIGAVACSRPAASTKVIKKDGTTVEGTIVDARTDEVVIKTETGEVVTIARQDIVALEDASDGDRRAPAARNAEPTEVPAQGNRLGADGGAGGLRARGSDAAVRPPSAGGATRTNVPKVQIASDNGTRVAGGVTQTRQSSVATRELIVPAGTRLNLALRSSIDSSTSRADDRVEATLTRPIMIDGTEILRVGTEIEGTVVGAMAARVNERAYVVVRFDRVRTTAGELAIQSDSVRREAASTLQKEVKRRGFRGAVGGALGAVVGRSRDALRIGESATSGAAAGANDAIQNGTDVRLAAGTPLTIRIAQPLGVPVSAR